MKYKMTVDFDNYATNPREYTESVGTIVPVHDYDLMGDTTDFSIEVRKMMKEEGPKETFRFLQEECGTTVVFPFGVTDHSGITVHPSSKNLLDLEDKEIQDVIDSIQSGWDNSLGGFIFDAKSTRDQFGLEGEDSGMTKGAVIQSLEYEIKEYAQWVSGEVYRYQIEEQCECCGAWSYSDGCGGFYDEEDCKEEGEQHMEYLKMQEKKK